MLVKQRPHVSEGEPAHLFEHPHGGEVSIDELPANFSALAALEVSQLFSLRSGLNDRSHSGGLHRLEQTATVGRVVHDSRGSGQPSDPPVDDGTVSLLVGHSVDMRLLRSSVANQADARTGRTRVAEQFLSGSKAIGAASVSSWNHASRRSVRRNE